MDEVVVAVTGGGGVHIVIDFSYSTLPFVLVALLLDAAEEDEVEEVDPDDVPFRMSVSE